MTYLVVLNGLLKDRGFVWCGGRFMRKPLLAIVDETGWLRIVSLSSRAPKAPVQEPHAEAAGPWKVAARDHMVADLPVKLLTEGSDREQCSQILGEALAWLLDDDSDPQRESPSREVLEALLPAAERTIRSGSFLSTIEVETTPSLILRCSLARASLPAYGTSRRKWLDATLTEWQAAARMARIAMADDSLSAVVDLTGVPSNCVEGLITAGAACLRAALPILTPALEILMDPQVNLSAIAYDLPRPQVSAGPERTPNKKGG